MNISNLRIGAFATVTKFLIQKSKLLLPGNSRTAHFGWRCIFKISYFSLLPCFQWFLLHATVVPRYYEFFPFSFGFYLDDNLERAVLCLINALQLDLWTDKKFEQVTLNSNFGGSFGTSSVVFIWAFIF